MTSSLHYAPNARRGFTLVELMVVIVIISILSSLTLAGLAVAQRNSKADKTRSTIRKLHEVIVPHYEGFLRRRVPLPTGLTSGTAIALERLNRIRTLTLYEMPDSWADVAVATTGTAGTLASGTVPSYAWTGVSRGYASARGTSTPDNASAECLFLVISRGAREPGAVEAFRQDEIGDTDGDGALEFRDGWNQPITFFRWAPGFSSPQSFQQFANASTHHDPFDLQRVDPDGYALVPLIVSLGPDGLIGLNDVPAAAWSQLAQSAPKLQSIVNLMSPQLGSVANASSVADNITNHDLNTR